MLLLHCEKGSGTPSLYIPFIQSFVMKYVLILILVSEAKVGGLSTVRTSDETKDYITNGCHNFNFSSNDSAYLPSEVITISGSCDNTREGTKTLCPSWSITSSLVEIKFLRNSTILDGTTCTRIMEVQVLNFNTTNKRVQLLVEFEDPKSEPIKEINVERSDDWEVCRQSRDCFYSDQFCSPSGKCTCSIRWVFVRNFQKCVPAIYRVKDQCQYTEQCQVPNSLCPNSTCECKSYYNPSSNYTECLAEGAAYGAPCSTDENCLVKNKHTVCKDNNCACSDGYTYNYEYETEKGCHPNGAASLVTGFGWRMAALIVMLLSLPMKT